MVLEAHYGLDINNSAHIWLPHTLFLADINSDATLFAEAWNRHKMSFRGEASQSPAEMWGFGIPILGMRGEELQPHEIEEYGIDWPALRDENVMLSHRANDSQPDASIPWTGRVGLPQI